MLFKRKSGKESSNGTRKGWAGKDGPRSGDNGLRTDVDANDWGADKIDGALNEAQKEKNDNLDNTRRAVAQRRASKKLASIDWDIAAREEITALLNGGSKEPDSQPGNADNDLEAVRKAIAKRKSQTDHSSQKALNEKIASNDQQANSTQDVDHEEEHGPRLDWLVDFISDEPSPPPSNIIEIIDKREDNSIENKEQNINGIFSDFPAGDTGFTGEDSSPTEQKKITDSTAHLRNKSDKEQTSSPFPPDLTIGDGFGGVNLLGSEQGQNNSPQKLRIPLDDRNDQNGSSGNKKTASHPGTKPSQNIGVKQVDGRRGENDKLDSEQKKQSPATQHTRKSAPIDLDNLKTKDRVVGLLLRKQIVNMSQVYEAQKIKERENQKEALWRILVELNGVNKDAIYEEAARIYAFPVADVEGKLDAKFVRSVLETLSDENRDQLLNLHLVPYESQGDEANGGVKLAFITHDPMRTEVRRVMKELKLDRFDLYYAPQSAVNSIITEAFPRKNEYLERMTEDPMAFDLGMSYEDADIIDEDALEAEISRSSLINLFEATLVEAVRQGASDVHIYPNAQKKVEIHFRVDGRLTLWHTEHKVHPEALLAVIKDNAMNVDRFERDAAQDGYIQRWIDDVLIRFRVSVLPIANISHEIRSESIVIRVLDDRKVIRDLRKLGLLDEAMKKFEQAISQPHGMVILTGPTGSGKSTTLVAALHQVITGEVNVLTVEDPVEYIIPGVRQIKLNYKLELENALRAILRHDPDVVMVGEMRDRKTAELAIKLANTGHLTFSTLHTNDAPSAISRLYKMGIEPFLIAYAINLIVAQRLIRVLCSNCKQPDLDPDPIMLEKLGFTKEEISSTTFYLPGKDSECPVCKGVGYKGRRAVSEALYFSREVRHMIVEADKMIDEGAIKDQAVKEGMMTLSDSAREVVKLGQTSVREMIRVVTTQG